ncbi:MAG TPA: diacylglycerol kinase family protein, partial [Candidatus Manganitrophaceae bacterium]|nr:diacylglycerol kinase family protein [Candidatus Manganitrophaceae bacterium]
MKKPNSFSFPAERPPIFSNVLVIINPTSGTAGRRKKLRTILQHLQTAAGRLEIVYTACALDATRVAKEKRKEGFSLIICAGGDGTINEVINGLLGEADREGEKEIVPPLAILPTGTGNGLAREIGIPLDPVAAYRAILTGTPRPIYPGRVEPLSAESGRTEPDGIKFFPRYFILFVGAGFDGFVIDAIDRRRGIFRRLPKLSIYFLFGFASLFSYPYPTLHFSVDGTSYRGSTGMITKAKLILGPWTVAPRADIGRPALTLCLIKATGVLGYVKTLISFLLFGKSAKRIEYIDGKEMKVFGTNAFLHADGESLGTVPARIAVS